MVGMDQIRQGLNRRHHKIGRTTQSHKHTGQEGVSQLFPCSPWIELSIEGQRCQGRGMGAGKLKMADEQMTDHRFGPGQGINAAAMAVSLQGVTVGVFWKTSHDGNRGRACIPQPLSCAQKGIGPRQGPPADSTLTQLQMHPKGNIRRHDRTDIQSEGGPAAVGNLQVSEMHLPLNAGIHQQTDALLTHAVPVYWGDPTVHLDFDPACFVHLRDFADVDACIEVAEASPLAQEFRRRLFSKIVPNVKSLGLLSDRQRERFAALGILEFETNTTSDVDQDIEEERKRRSGELAA